MVPAVPTAFAALVHKCGQKRAPEIGLRHKAKARPTRVSHKVSRDRATEKPMGYARPYSDLTPRKDPRGSPRSCHLTRAWSLPATRGRGGIRQLNASTVALKASSANTIANRVAMTNILTGVSSWSRSSGLPNI